MSYFVVRGCWFLNERILYQKKGNCLSHDGFFNFLYASVSFLSFCHYMDMVFAHYLSFICFFLVTLNFYIFFSALRVAQSVKDHAL
jgi:hypothetical protein